MFYDSDQELGIQSNFGESYERYNTLYINSSNDSFSFNNENALIRFMEEKENEKIEFYTPFSEKRTDYDEEQEVNLLKSDIQNNNEIMSNELISPNGTNQQMEIEVNNSNLLINSNPITQISNDNISITKFSDDNLRRKCKHIILDSLLYLINYKIRVMYKDNIGKGILKKELKKLNQKQKSESNIKYNKEFLYKSIGEIFSDKISSRITICPPEHNKIIIQSLLNEKDINKKIFFNNLFSLTFFQCLEHFRETKKYPELKEMNTLKNELKKYSNIDYASNLEYYFKNYETIINKKKSRKSRKQKEINNKN